LGERELCKLEVIGSIPFSSTICFANGSLLVIESLFCRLSPAGPFSKLFLKEVRSWRTRNVLRLLSSAFARKGQKEKQTFIDIVEEEFAWAIEASRVRSVVAPFTEE
jgi:hypothetical protein